MSGLIFIDRDGVINDDQRKYVTRLADWRPIEGSLDAITRLSKSGWDVVVITNQSALARGMMEAPALADIHAAFHEAVAARGGRIAAILYCPHHPDDGCSCRKPAPGLIHQAERLLGRSAVGAPLIGDRLSDLGAARNAGCRPILVRTGYGSDIASDDPGLEGVTVHRDLAEAVDALLRDDTPPRDGSESSEARDVREAD